MDTLLVGIAALGIVILFIIGFVAAVHEAIAAIRRIDK